MPIRQAKALPAVTTRELEGGRSVCLLHKGPYEQLGHFYAKILNYVKANGYRGTDWPVLDDGELAAGRADVQQRSNEDVLSSVCQ